MPHWLKILLDLPPLKLLLGGVIDRPLHFSARSRRRMNRARFISHLS